MNIFQCCVVGFVYWGLVSSSLALEAADDELIVTELVAKKSAIAGYETSTQVEPKYLHTEVALTESIVTDILDEGERFEKNAPLLRLDLKQTKLELRSLNSDLQYYDRQIEVMSNQVKRYQQLAQTQSVGQEQLESAHLKLYKAQNHYARTQLDIESIQWTLEQSQHLSAFVGMVSKRHVSAGSRLTKGMPLLDVVSIDLRRIIFDLPSHLAYVPLDIRLVHQGDSVRLTDYQIVPKQHNRALSFQVNADVSKVSVNIGEQIKVIIAPKNSNKLFSAPHDAVIEEGELKVIYTVNNDRIIHRYVVNIVSQSSDGYVISNNDLKDGELVVINGSSHIENGKIVNFKKLKNDT